jgi:NAD(P)-dependent dehydrogenase (short-subunit alcohol dehydrogenase family)
MVAKRLHSQGYRVAITGRRVPEGEAIAAGLDSTGATAAFYACDVGSYASQAKVFQAVWEKWGRLDALIANAGGVDRGSIYNFARRDAAVTDLPAEPDLTCTDVDFKGVIYGTTLATHFMRHNAPRKGGKIVVTGSMIGVHPCGTFPEYSSAKAGVHHFVRVMAPLLKLKEDITINCVMPGAVDTPAMPDFSTAFLYPQ